MELIFKESSQVLSGKPAYEVEFEASSDFSIHIERPAGGRFLVYQKSVANGKYSLVDGVGYQDYKDVFDIDFAGSVYPKWIKIVSEVEPTYAAIISDGEVTEIKAQSKVVEITSNGTTNITPDEGFAYLNGVKVKTNVPQEGGGQNEMRYFALSASSFDAVYYSTLAKYEVDGSTLIGPTLMYAEDSESIEGANRCIIAAAFDFNTKIRIGGNDYNNLFELWEISSVEEFIDRFGIEKEITEEQFYDPDFNPFA